MLPFLSLLSSAVFWNRAPAVAIREIRWECVRGKAPLMENVTRFHELSNAVFRNFLTFEDIQAQRSEPNAFANS
jgi:hypothetical protein